MNASSKIGDRAQRLSVVATLVAAWLALGIAGVFAQNGNPSVAATLLDPQIDVGDTTEYQISVVNARADSPPPVPVVAGLTFQYAGQERHSNLYFDNRSGMRSLDSTVYRYTVQAAHGGHYVIPGQEVMVNGTVMRTLPLALSAEETGAGGAPPPSQTVSAELIIPKKSAYVGESIPAEVRAYFGTDVRGHPDPEPILTGEGFSAQKFTTPSIGPQVKDGFRYTTATYKTAIAGLKIGNLTVGPAETEPVVRLPAPSSRHRHSGGGYDPFDNLFGGMNLQPEQRVKVHTDSVTLEIKPLPPGKLADFSGGIGQFKLDVEAEPRRAQAGDPVTVRLILSGQGNFERVNPPVLADETGLKVYPPSAKFKADDEVGLSGVKTFEQVVIADGARTSLPAYRFSYLDLGTGKYVSLDTPPVAVRIEGTVATPAPASALAQQTNPAPTATPAPTPARPAEDILYIQADAGAARDRAAFLPIYERRSFWLAQGVPLAALLAALAGLALRARARDEAARRQARLQREQAEIQRALRKEDTGRRDFYLAATRLAQIRAAAGRTDTPATASEISQARQLDPQTASSVQEIFHRRDELAYSGGQNAQDTVPADERRGVLATLETLGKNGK